MNVISIRGARTHNLKNISLDLPRDKLTVITGLSGSGKSSLAFDTIYAEGQRRYVESLSSYARQFLSMMEKPDLDSIEGLSPAISIEQKSTSHNPRSTVGTVTEIYDYLRLLFARVGTPRCPDHGVTLEAQSVSQMVDQVLALPAESAWLLLAPVVRDRKGEHLEVFESMRVGGFVRARVDGRVYELDEIPSLNRKLKHDIDIVVDRFKVRPDIQQRLAESFETTLRLGEGIAYIAPHFPSPGPAGRPLPKGEGKNNDSPLPPGEGSGVRELVFSARMACPHCGYSLQELEPRLFSFNAPHGACTKCDGLGQLQVFDAERVVAHPDLSLAAGAVRSWDKRNPFTWSLMQSLAKHYKFDLDEPFSELPKKIRDIVLFGSGEERLKFEYADERGGTRTSLNRFEGIVPNLERRYKETDSEAVREELAKYLSQQSCPECKGDRLNRAARHVFVADKRLPELCTLSVKDAEQFFTTMKLPGHKQEIAAKIIKEIGSRLGFLNNVGLEYLTLARSAETLSGGEAQRIRLASQIGAGLVGVTYVLDEPSIGLHQRDNQRLLNTLTRLRDLGNTVIVVEHDEEAIRAADHVVDIGPGAGVHGGRVLAQGTPADIEKSAESWTGRYLSGRVAIEIPKIRTPRQPKKCVHIRGASGNNLKNVSVEIPLGLMTCITGVSGSGKSTLINDTLYAYAARELNGAALQPAPFEEIEGLDQLDKVIDIDQSPIGRTPRSNPATYTGLFTPIRELFAQVPEARTRGYEAGRFSFNVKGGRCETCEGDGLIKVEMHFLPDVYVTCDTCKGKRYNRETLDIRYKGKTISDVLNLTVEDALAFFSAVPALRVKLETLMDVGLSYLTLGQNATTLSGGEAQRVKLAKELSRRDTGQTLYILDEPTTGLHFHDVAQLLKVLDRLRDHGNTVIVIEHNLDVIKRADWIIDLGPEGGSGGGTLVATGTPEDVAMNPASHTGHYLKALLKLKAA